MKKELEIYLDDTFSLVRSVTIKLDTIAEQMNARILEAYGAIFNETDPTTWRYFLNLNGDYFATDTLMDVVSLDTGATITYSKAILVGHPVTLERYKTDQVLRDNLIRRYPDQEILIKHILFPIPVADSIAAEDGTVLYHDERFVESNEDNLINDLETWIKSVVSRWHVHGFYLTDNLYAASFLGVLVANMSAKILNIRASYAKTYQAHSFHVKSYLDSHHDISNLYNLIDTKSLMWLYRNMSYIDDEVASTEVFEKILESFLEQNLIDSGTYRSVQESEEIKDGLPIPNFVYERLNGPADIGVFKSVKDILEKEVATISGGGLYGTDALLYKIGQIQRKLALANTTRTNTKILELSTSAIIDILHTNHNQIIIDNWLDSVLTGSYDDAVRFIDPNTSKEYIVDQKTAFVVFLNAVYKQYNIASPKFSNILTLYTIDPAVSTANLLNFVEATRGIDADVAYLVSLLPTPPVNPTPAQFNLYVADLLWALKKMVMYASQTSDNLNFGMLKSVMRNMFIETDHDPVTLDPVFFDVDDITTLYSRFNLPDMSVPGYDYTGLLKSLLEASTGFLLPIPEDTTTKFETIVDALSHITAYTTQKVDDLASSELLANLDFGYSRISESLSTIFYPELELDCTPRGIEPILSIFCSELPEQLTSIVVDETNLETDCSTGDIISPTFCGSSDYATVSDCVEGDGVTVSDCEPFVARGGSFCGPTDKLDALICVDFSKSVGINCDGDVVVDGVNCTPEVLTFDGINCVNPINPFSPTFCVLADPANPTICSDPTTLDAIGCEAIPPMITHGVVSYTSRDAINCETLRRPTANMECTCAPPLTVADAIWPSAAPVVPPGPSGPCGATWNVFNSVDIFTPTGRVGHGQVLLQDGRLLLVGGQTDINDPWTMQGDVEYLDPVTEVSTASAVTVFATAGKPQPVVLPNGNVYVAYFATQGGYENASTDYTIINPLTDTSNTNFIGLPKAMSGGATSLLPDGTVLISGGAYFDLFEFPPVGAQTQTEVRIYDPVLDIHTIGTPLPVAIGFATQVTMSDGKVLLFGGITDFATNAPNDTVYIYDPATLTWGVQSTLTYNGTPGIPGDYKFFDTATDGDKVMLFAANAGVCYDYATDTWTDLPVIPSPVSYLSITNVPGIGNVTTGGIDAANTTLGEGYYLS